MKVNNSYYGHYNIGSGLSSNDLEFLEDFIIDIFNNQTALIKRVPNIDDLKDIQEPLDGSVYRLDTDILSVPADYGLWIFTTLQGIGDGIESNDGTDGKWVKIEGSFKPLMKIKPDRYYNENEDFIFNDSNIVGGEFFPIINNESVLLNRTPSNITRISDNVIKSNISLYPTSIIMIVIE